MTDTRIIALYNQRSEEAIRASEEAYGSYCRAVALGILSVREDAEECVSDTWWHAWNAIPPARPTVLRLFFAKITRNLSFSRWRAAHAEKRTASRIAEALEELAECAAPETTEDAVILSELTEAVNRFLAALGERERGIFLRRYFYVESAAQIAGRYAMSEAAVRVNLSRVRKKLREHLTKEGYL